MRRTSIAVSLSILLAAAAVAQVNVQVSEWAAGPVKYLLTREEAKQWKAVRSDQDAAAFIDLFWARRDPTPGTPRNEFREEFDKRVDMADREFSFGKMRGALTDRGKVLILLGPPYQASSRGGSSSTSSLGVGRAAPTDASGGLALPGTRGTLAQQVWTYAHDRKPQFIPQDRFVVVFVDEGVNEWQLANTERSNTNAVFLRAVDAFIASPGLTRAPVYGGASVRAKDFRSAELKKSFTQFHSGEKSSLGPAYLTWGEFVTPAGEPFVSAQLYAAAGSGIEPGQKVTFFAVVENAGGEVVAVDESNTVMATSGTDSYVDKSLRLDPGNYTATFGLAGVDGTIVAAQRVPMTIAALDAAAPAISPLILSSNVYALATEAAPTDPFTFGALKVVPKGDSLFTPKGDLWYFLELRNPGLTEGKPAVQVQVDIAGKSPKGPVAMKFPLAPAEVVKLPNDRYAVGLAIPLEGFVPGDYTMKVKVVDTVAPKTYEAEKTFHVRGL